MNGGCAHSPLQPALRDFEKVAQREPTFLARGGSAATQREDEDSGREHRDGDRAETAEAIGEEDEHQSIVARQVPRLVRGSPENGPSREKGVSASHRYTRAVSSQTAHSSTGSRFDAIRRAAIVVVLMSIAAIPLVPTILLGGFPAHHDGRRYEILTTLFADAIANGQCYPRWLPDLCGGKGYPTFLFYQPLVFYVAAALRQLPFVTAATSSYAADYLFAVAGVAGAYRLARSIAAGGGAMAWMVVALLFALTPYAFTNLHLRGDHSEFAAMMLTPWPLVAVRKMRACSAAAVSTVRLLIPILTGAATTALIVFGHPAVALLFAFVLAIVLLGEWKSLPSGPRRVFFGSSLTLIVLAALLSSPYWFVMWQSSASVHLERVTEGPFHPSLHPVPLRELLFGRAGLPPTDAPDAGTTTPVALGLPHWILAAVGIAGCFSARRRRPALIVIAVAYLVLIVLMTPLATPLWRLHSPLAMVQFPYRLLSVTAVLQIALASFAVANARRVTAVIVLSAACLLAAAWHASMFRANPTEIAAAPDGSRRFLSWPAANDLIDAETRELPFKNTTYSLMHEFDPIWQTEPGPVRGDESLFAANVPIRDAQGSTKYHGIATFDGGAAGGAAVIRQLYFPGWRVEINDRAVPDETLRADLRPDGQMAVGLPPGTGRIEAYYDGPPGWRARIAITLAGIASALVGVVWWHRKVSRGRAREDSNGSVAATP